MTGTIDKNLEGMVALVTGGAVRVGRALALALAGRGVRLALHYGSSTEAAAMTVAAIHDLGGHAEAFQADLRDISQVGTLVDRAAERLGRIDILVNSAATFVPQGFADTAASNWDEQFAINLRAPFFLAQAFARHVGSERAGQIVNIADWRAVRPDPVCLAYSLTKAGIAAMTQGLALALAPNIRVNAIAPGAILPPPGHDETYLKRLGDKIPLRHPGSPADVAAALLYLVTAQFVTGHVLFVDGGEQLIGHGTFADSMGGT